MVLLSVGLTVQSWTECQNLYLHQHQECPKVSYINKYKINCWIPASNKHTYLKTLILTLRIHTLNSAITAVKQHIKHVAKTTDLVGAKGLFRTCCCKKHRQALSKRNREAFMFQWVYMWTVLATCMCAKKANWTNTALTNIMQNAARKACRFHRSNGTWKVARGIQSEVGRIWNFGTPPGIYRKRHELLTSMEYALPRRKLTSKAHINAADFDLIPMLML